MATVEKIRKDIEKTKEKISAQQKRLRGAGGATHRGRKPGDRSHGQSGADGQQGADRLPEGLRQRSYHLPDGMMEAEAAPDPDDEDMKGMEDGEDEA